MSHLRPLCSALAVAALCAVAVFVHDGTADQSLGPPGHVVVSADGRACPAPPLSAMKIELRDRDFDQLPTLYRERRADVAPRFGGARHTLMLSPAIPPSTTALVAMSHARPEVAPRPVIAA